MLQYLTECLTCDPLSVQERPLNERKKCGFKVTRVSVRHKGFNVMLLFANWGHFSQLDNLTNKHKRLGEDEDQARSFFIKT